MPKDLVVVDDNIVRLCGEQCPRWRRLGFAKSCDSNKPRPLYPPAVWTSAGTKKQKRPTARTSTGSLRRNPAASFEGEWVNLRG